VRAEHVRLGPDGTRFVIVMPHGRVELFLRLVGLHNVRNALAAAAASLSLGASELTVAAALEDARPVPGRLELVEAPMASACTACGPSSTTRTRPIALEQVCSTLAELSEGRLHVVFGCGGDRDRSQARADGRRGRAACTRRLS
jgi:UDP-N-acetylmuramyl tripeptide synthase